MLVLAGLLVMAVAAFWGLMASDALLPLGTGKHGWQLVKTKDGVLSGDYAWNDRQTNRPTRTSRADVSVVTNACSLMQTATNTC